MVSDKQLEANRQNALQSTGPKTAEGVKAVKNNALRHGLRAIQTVVPGKEPMLRKPNFSLARQDGALGKLSGEESRAELTSHCVISSNRPSFVRGRP